MDGQSIDFNTEFIRLTGEGHRATAFLALESQLLYVETIANDDHGHKEKENET